MSPSECAWLHVPGNEQTLRLPVSRRFTNRNDLSVGCYLHSALGGSYTAPLQSGCKGSAFSSKNILGSTTGPKIYNYLTHELLLTARLFAFFVYFCRKKISRQ